MVRHYCPKDKCAQFRFRIILLLVSIATTIHLLYSYRSLSAYYFVDRDENKISDTDCFTEGDEWKFHITKNYKSNELHKWMPIIADESFNLSEPGGMGRAVIVPINMRKIADKMFFEQNYNLYASEMMPLNRSLPDVRHEECKNIAYQNRLPSTSVIIIFHNEALATLLRTIWSIIQRSPQSLLQEIILVDDQSDASHLGRVLEKIIELLPVKINLIRSSMRLGLISARLLGAEHAVGSVLTFLDAHIECTKGWLEPLLDRIASDRSTVVCPSIDSINIRNFSYSKVKVTWIGFFWNLLMNWNPVPYEEIDRIRINKTIPIRSPNMVGCAFAIDREFFFEIGSYDRDLEIWGSENLELSLRVWQCGGTLEIIPCSHIGHLYRSSSYSFDGNQRDILMRNNIRVAEVWMDEYKEFFYTENPTARKLIASAGNLTDRKALRQKLQCKSFRWYLENVYPESTMNSHIIAMGEIKNAQNNQCLDTLQRRMWETIGTYSCHGLGGTQAFVYTKDNRILKSSSLCVTANVTSNLVHLIYCRAHTASNIHWKYDKERKTILEMASGKCLGIINRNLSSNVELQNCDRSLGQQWVMLFRT